MRYLAFLLVLPSLALSNPNDLTEETELKMELVSSCQEPTADFRTYSSISEREGFFRVKLSLAKNCATSLKNPKLYMNGYGFTIGADEVSSSDLYTACECRGAYKFSFKFPEYRDYGIANVFVTINGAVVAQNKILNKAL